MWKAAVTDSCSLFPSDISTRKCGHRLYFAYSYGSRNPRLSEGGALENPFISMGQCDMFLELIYGGGFLTPNQYRLWQGLWFPEHGQDRSSFGMSVLGVITAPQSRALFLSFQSSISTYFPFLFKIRWFLTTTIKLPLDQERKRKNGEGQRLVSSAWGQQLNIHMY